MIVVSRFRNRGASVLAGLCLATAGCAIPTRSNAPKPTLAENPDAWELKWSDEFDTDGAPNPEKWGYEVGFIRNRELQYYTKNRRENARVENGCLVIEGRVEKYKKTSDATKTKGWRGRRDLAHHTSASLITLGKMSWKYGRMEIRAKIPAGKGTWPAIWMMGANRPEVQWLRCGEVDILEFVGKKPDDVHSNVHYLANGKHRSKGTTFKVSPPPTDDFHVYALEWNENRMDFFYDGRKFHSFNVDDAGKGADNPFRKPQYLILNLALGGSWGGKLDDSKAPWKFLVDYVRIYKRKQGAQKNNQTH